MRPARAPSSPPPSASCSSGQAAREPVVLTLPPDKVPSHWRHTDRSRQSSPAIGCRTTRLVRTIARRTRKLLPRPLRMTPPRDAVVDIGHVHLKVSDLDRAIGFYR